MIKTTTNKNQYQLNPILETDITSYNLPVTLFGKEWLLMDDYWMKHIHIKVTDICNAKCPFCIEKDSNILTNWANIYHNVSVLLYEMNKSGNLCTVSITGGEPSLYKKEVGTLIDIIKRYDCFLTMNTNFSNIVDSKMDLDYIDISRHKIGIDDICGINELSLSQLSLYKTAHPRTKVRIQCVLHENGLKTIADFIDFVRAYKGIADDISVRRLITTDSHIPISDLYIKLKQYCYDNAEFIEQTLKDYYVYEVWNLEGINIHFSHSNMSLLKNMESVEPDNLIREFVVHPDGMICGSWYRDKKIITK